MKKRCIYLFACIEKNIGDDLFIYVIANRYKNINFIISEDASYMRINNLSNLVYSKQLKYWLKVANISTNNRFKNNTAKVLKNILELGMKKHDSIYIVGNAFKNMNYKGSYQLNWLFNRMKISKNFFLLSTNFGPTNDNRWKDNCLEAFKKMTDVCFRDLYSFSLFKDLKNVRYAPDAIISVPQNKESNKVKKECVIISIIDCMFEGRPLLLKENSKNYEDKMVELINSYSKNSTRVVLLNSNSVQDNPATTRIYNKCLEKDMISIYNYNGNIKEVFNLYNDATEVIATRLHTIILSWIYNIPVFPIVYDIKVKNMLESYQFNESMINIEDISKIDYSYIKNTFKNYSFVISEELRNQSEKQFEKLDDYLR